MTTELYTPYGEIQQEVDWQTLSNNETWFNASLELFKANHGSYAQDADDPILSKYEGADFNEKVADYGLKQMAGFNFDLGEMVVDTYNITNAEQQQKEAFVYLLDQYDEVNTSWHTTKQAGWEVLSDVTNWVGLATFGTGTIASTAAKVTGKAAIRAALKASIEAGGKKATTQQLVKESAQKVGTLGAAEGALHGGTGAHLNQSVRMDAGAQTDYNTGATVLGATAGAVFGGAAAVGIDVAFSKLSGKLLSKRIDDELAKDAQQIEINTKEAADIAKRRQAKEERTPEQVEADLVNQEAILNKVENARNPKTEDTGRPATKKRRYVKGIKELFRTPARLINKMRGDADSVEKTLKEWEKQSLTESQVLDASRTVNEAVQILHKKRTRVIDILENTPNLTKETREALTKEIEDMSSDVIRMEGVREHVNSWKGRYLQDIQNFLDYKRADDGTLSPEARVKAYHEFYTKKMNRITDVFNRKMDELLDMDNPKYSPDKAMKVMRQREAFRKRMEEAMIDNDPTIEPSKIKKLYNKLGESLVEMSISGRFSPQTVAVNTLFPFLKTMTYPIIEQLMRNPLKREMWRRTAQQYMYMMANTKASLRAAQYAFRYEQTGLTQDPSKFLEGGIKTKGHFAAFYRSIARGMSATDAYMQEMAAMGDITLKTFDSLLDQATKKGLKGAELKEFIDARMASEIDKGYKYVLDHNTIGPIVEKGIGLGKKGENLEKWVLRELDDVTSYEPDADELLKFTKMGERQGLKGKALDAFVAERVKNKKLRALRTLENPDSVEMVKDLLYKKEFSKDNAFERAMGTVEGVQQKHWEARFLGNLFFRTLVRLFNEATRISPVLNTMLPTFQRDLQGINGVQKQARAQTEATISHAVLMIVMSKWAQGEIQGSPDKNWHNTMETERSDQAEPMTINIGGKDRSYRWADPFRIPLMTLTNTLDNIRKQQIAEREDYALELKVGRPLEESEKQAESAANRAFAIAFGSLISVFKDSGMTTGATDLVKLIVRASGGLTSDEGEDRENSLDLLQDFLTKKILMPLPNTVTKIAKGAFGDDQITRPLTPRQRLLSQLSPNHTEIPRKYDFFGNPRKMDTPLVQLIPWAGSTVEDRSAKKKGLSKEQDEVQNFVARLEAAGFGTFNRPKLKDPMFGKTDLRTIYTTMFGTKITVMDAIRLRARDAYGQSLAENLLPFVDNTNLTISQEDAENMSGIISAIKAERRKVLDLALKDIIDADPKLRNMVDEKEYIEFVKSTIPTQKI